VTLAGLTLDRNVSPHHHAIMTQSAIARLRGTTSNVAMQPCINYWR